jgi:hypothetical protein
MRKLVLVNLALVSMATALCLFATLAIPASLAAQENLDHQPTFTTFDVPGAGTGAQQGTFPTSINPEGAITGYYLDASFVQHGFLRARNGSLTTIDVPGGVNGTYPANINPEGAITGYYCDASVCHGFLRARNGSLTTFDVPGDINGIVPVSINPEGEITGFSIDVNLVFHGFLRARDGSLTTFDVPGAGTGAFQGTFYFGESFFKNNNGSGGINPAGAITASYVDASNMLHGFLRAPDGTFTTFDVSGGNSTSPTAIAFNGAITGIYFLPIAAGNYFGGDFRGFLRKPDGEFSTFDAATYPPCCIWTFPQAINPEGEITGYYNDGHNLNRGFLRARNGTITTFDAPGAGTGLNQGTLAVGINPEGAITGYYTDATNVNHGFLRLPAPYEHDSKAR